MIELEIPYAISLDGLKEVIAGWYRAQAHRQAVSIESVSKAAKFKPKTIQRQNKFLSQLGVVLSSPLSSAIRGRTYFLTKNGEPLGRSADYQQDEMFKDTMMDLIIDWSEFDPILEFITESPDVTRDTLLKRIMMLSDRPSNDKNAKMGSGCLVDLLEWIDFINFKNDSVILSDKLLSKIKKDVDRIPVKDDTKDFDKPDVISEAVVSFENVHIRNIRSILDVEIPVKKLNLFIGENTSGKSSVVHSILALRNLQWGRIFANSSYREMDWLRRIETKDPMFVCLKGKVTSKNVISDVILTVFFTPSLSYCVQLCVFHNDRWLCDTSFFSEKNDLVVPFDELKGFGEIQKTSDKMRESLEKLNELFKKVIDIDKDRESTSESNRVPTMFSIMMDDRGNYAENYSSRRLLGSWPGLLPEFLRDESTDLLRAAYLEARPALRNTIDSIEFVPVMRGFLSLQYSQEDTPQSRLSDDLDFVGQILNKLILPDEVDAATSDKLKRWAKEFGIDDFETVLQPERKIEARGRIGHTKAKLPVALYGFGSNQFLSLVGKCSFALTNAPIIIEEPEIHLHPHLQARTMDFLIEMMKDGHQLFVTTHSEHLIGRLQRRIAEKKIKAKDVAILWVKYDTEKKGTKVEEVKMDTKGIFHEGLMTYLSFLEEELEHTQKARQTRKG